MAEPKHAVPLGTGSIVAPLLAAFGVIFYEGLGGEELSLPEWTSEALAEFYSPAFAPDKIVLVVVDEGVHYVVSTPQELGAVAGSMSSFRFVVALPRLVWELMRGRIPPEKLREPAAA